MPDLSQHKKAQRVRIYISENDHWRGKPLDTVLLETLRSRGMAGATVFRGAAGFGAGSRIHTTRSEILSMNLPVVIEVVDTSEKINAVLEVIYPMVSEGLITLEETQVIKYTHRLLHPLPVDRQVSEVMTRSLVTLTPDMPVQLAWKKMLENVIKAAPVIDSDWKVVGILTNEDLFERAGIKQRLSIAVRLSASEINPELQALNNSPLRVSDVMTQPVVTVFENDSLGTATARMVKTGLKRLPVVNDHGNLVGILSRLDILRQVAGVQQIDRDENFHTGVVQTVGDIMTGDIPMVYQEDDLPTLIDKFSRSGSHRLIVVDAAGKVIGLVSDSDVVSRIQPEKRRGILDALRRIGQPPAGKETAFDLMSPGPLTASPDLPIVEAAQKMLADSRKWLIVVDDQNIPLGLVDRQILLEAIAS